MLDNERRKNDQVCRINIPRYTDVVASLPDGMPLRQSSFSRARLVVWRAANRSHINPNGKTNPVCRR
ncbi:hypothetical protein [Janthinobacterium sp. RB2P8]|uniref:hypothetical protein n=1 Tax=Janthinobacterium sp. RB2P8 TaxID=3424191 RepID=UPI003F260D5E